ncbi:MAG TPA: PASTA domain-containing protein, partial [Intrasporangium sp.]|nr:PASTA domain-containing protein [Intrasporangium sp.]
NVTGRSVSDARRILERAGFSVQVGDSRDSNVRRGLVAGTSPSGKAPDGSTVTIHPSNGPSSSNRGGGGGPWPQPSYTIVLPPDGGGKPGKPTKPPKPR